MIHAAHASRFLWGLFGEPVNLARGEGGSVMKVLAKTDFRAFVVRGGVDATEAPVKVRVKAGRGIGAVDVPRGLLIHDYTYDEDGHCVRANCVIPTNQNHHNINRDLAAFAPTLLERPETEIERNLEMLVRAYNPCVSCSTHALKVTFK